MNKADLQNMIQRFLDRTITEDEYAVLVEAMQENEEEWQEVLVPIIKNTIPDDTYRPEEWESVKQYILSQAPPQQAPVHRIGFLKSTWWKYAAAVIIIVGAGAYFWFLENPANQNEIVKTSESVLYDFPAPQTNRATITLPGGKTVYLDSAGNGTLAMQGNVRLTKLSDGQIAYHSAPGVKSSELIYNTLSNPRGSKVIDMTLADGSRVWLNAGSSVRYPVAFVGKERRVEVTGEAYFEVAKDKSKKFIVTGDGRRETADATADEKQRLQIEVLGTHFNVNAYADEPIVSTTLLEGSIQLTVPAIASAKAGDSLTAHGSRLTNNKSVHTSITLIPGQQGQLHGDKLSLAAKPDLEQVMAWKNGAFNFQNIELPEALRQISRWYDVEIVYTSQVPKITLGGGIGRDLNLSEVLKILQGLGVKTRVEGKKLYISE